MAVITVADYELFLGVAPYAGTELAQINSLIPMAESAIWSVLQHTLERKQHTEYYPIGRSSRSDFAGPLDLSPASDPEDIVVERINVGQSDVLILKNTPVISTAIAVWVDVAANGGQAATPFAGDKLLTYGTDYWLDATNEVSSGVFLSETGILRRQGLWPTDPRSIKVTYYGGVDASMLASNWAFVKLAILLTLANLHRLAKNLARGDGGPRISESIGKYSYTLDSAFVAQYGGSGNCVPPAAINQLQSLRNYGRYMR